MPVELCRDTISVLAYHPVAELPLEKCCLVLKGRRAGWASTCVMDALYGSNNSTPDTSATSASCVWQSSCPDSLVQILHKLECVDDTCLVHAAACVVLCDRVYRCIFCH